jgi:hypothetical protein
MIKSNQPTNQNYIVLTENKSVVARAEMEEGMD